MFETDLTILERMAFAEPEASDKVLEHSANLDLTW